MEIPRCCFAHHRPRILPQGPFPAHVSNGAHLAGEGMGLQGTAVGERKDGGANTDKVTRTPICVRSKRTQPIELRGKGVTTGGGAPDI